jgi:uncharacterized protein YabE (DUF348 family)
MKIQLQLQKQQQQQEEEEVTFATNAISDQSLQPEEKDYIIFPRLDSNDDDNTS